jgi:hypothetical protein
VAKEAAEIGRLRASLAGSKSENEPTYAASPRSWQVLCFDEGAQMLPEGDQSWRLSPLFHEDDQDDQTN